MKVVITAFARANLRDIARYIRQNNPKRAATFVNELLDRCAELANAPEAFALVPGHEPHGIRRRPYGNYLIFYRVGGNRIEVLHVLHGAQAYERILFPEG